MLHISLMCNTAKWMWQKISLKILLKYPTSVMKVYFYLLCIIEQLWSKDQNSPSTNELSRDSNNRSGLGFWKFWFDRGCRTEFSDTALLAGGMWFFFFILFCLILKDQHFAVCSACIVQTLRHLLKILVT